MQLELKLYVRNSVKSLLNAELQRFSKPSQTNSNNNLSFSSYVSLINIFQEYLFIAASFCLAKKFYAFLFVLLSTNK